MELLLTDEFEIDRALYLARVPELSDWPVALAERRLPVDAELGVALLVVTGAAQADDGVLAELAAYCRRHGAHWFSTWGPGAQRVSDAFARSACALTVDPGWGRAVPGDDPALALWHDSTLAEALEFFWDAALIDLSRPDDRRRPVSGGWRRPARIVFVSGPDRAAWEEEVRETTHAVLNF